MPNWPTSSGIILLSKRKRSDAHPRRKVCLNSIRGVAMEQGRLYRAAINQRISSAEAARLTYILREVRCSLEAIPPEPKVEQATTLNIITIDQDSYIRDTAMSESRLVIEHIPSEPLKTPPIEATLTVDVSAIEFEPEPEPEPIPEPAPAPVRETIDAPPERPMMKEPGGGWSPVPPRSSLRPPPRKTVW
jgi:hypothetical protein